MQNPEMFPPENSLIILQMDEPNSEVQQKNNVGIQTVHGIFASHFH